MNTASELLDHMRGHTVPGNTPLGEFAALMLPCLPVEEAVDFVGVMIDTALEAARETRDVEAALAALFLRGMECGRELERR